MNECIMCERPALAPTQFCSIKCDHAHEELYEAMAELEREQLLNCVECNKLHEPIPLMQGFCSMTCGHNHMY